MPRMAQSGSNPCPLLLLLLCLCLCLSLGFPSLKWIRPGPHGRMPPSAIAGGCLGPMHNVTYIGRVVNVTKARHTIPGAIHPWKRRCYIAYHGSILASATYEVLTNPKHTAVRWVAASHGRVPRRAVVGGHEAHGPHYVGRTLHRGRHLCVGKVYPYRRVIYYAFEDYEYSSYVYEVLAFGS